MVPLRHVPSLFLATAFTFGGMLPLFNARRAILEFGLPERIANNASAQSIMNVYSARMTVIGLAIYTLHYQQLYAAVDTIMLCLGYIAFVDGYICWKEGVPKTAAFRSISAVVVAAMGYFNVTSGS